MATRRDTTTGIRSKANPLTGGAEGPSAGKGDTPDHRRGSTPPPSAGDPTKGNRLPDRDAVEFKARVARKAFELFERRGQDHGHDVEDWLEAERMVLQELQGQPSGTASV